MKIEQCKNCIKIKGSGDKNRKYSCLYHKKSLKQIKECDIADEFRIPVCKDKKCEGHIHPMDMVSKKTIDKFDEYVFECFYCNNNMTITWAI